ncbi:MULTISPECIES: alpha-galactosidase [unclassified Crossiella]|uniref:alpha-galactosidase n=1 Tax=unclassified Crossiella TaxID=2620835 RepID=UPI001FFED640|nr:MULTISPECIES: alpha-galactosidase [unclassified Crossiella]MCK2241444.1 alpha-galactosidase [Crossiella sp. S99.2]MCK2255684.1 alpha-galactosidase [Crossiella sp. S99.1]
MPRCDGEIVQLRAAGVGVVVDLRGDLPVLLHWGADLGELTATGLAALAGTATPAVLNNAPDLPRTLTVWPTEADGWSGTPGHQGHRAGRRTTPRLRLTEADLDGTALVMRLTDQVSELDVELHYHLDAAGVLSVRSVLTDRSVGEPYDLAGVSTLLPLPRRAGELLDFTGKWCRERSPQRTPLNYGSHVREVRRGKPGHDSPHLLLAGTPGFDFGTGEVWGVHVAWSGNQRYLAEQLPEGAGPHAAVLGGGELLTPGEVRLAPGEVYESPECLFTFSNEGLDGIAERIHTRLRARATHPANPRPLVLNTWEAVYFDHDLDRLRSLADAAAKVGVERLVLDDGWFGSRRNDTRGLGDWVVSEEMWPQGLGPLVEHVRGLGLQFGLWVEPEMINLDSDLARAHPDWLLGPSVGLGAPSRHQYVLNIAHPDAYEHILGRLIALVGEYRIDYLKWDHNRELHEAVHRDPAGDRPAGRAQTLALYRLLDELKARFPALEIESCAGGGGRVDLGILARTDRVWGSDCNDPVERQQIQRWTTQLIPPELIGAHVGDRHSHTTGRDTDDSFRFATALFGHAGIEADLTRLSAEQLAKFTAWAGLYREFRPLLHSGRVVRADLEGEVTLLHGVVGADSALFCWARLASSVEGQSGRVRFPGLDATAEYRVRIRTELGLPTGRQVAAPGWFTDAQRDWVRLPGAILTTAGVPLPTLDPQQAMLIEFRRE